MKRIFVPTSCPSDWQRLLAQPKLHWKKGYSAMTTAACWEAAKGQLPAEVGAVLEASGDPALAELRLVAAFPEWEVPLVGGENPSYTDVLALASNTQGLVVLAVEAKVEEQFGPTLLEKRTDPSPGQDDRMAYLHKVLHLKSPLPDGIRYQLVHRTASTLIAAAQFHAETAVMLVQSFSPTARWHGDFVAFCAAMGARSLTEGVYAVPGFDHPSLFLAWCAGSKEFLETELPSVC